MNFLRPIINSLINSTTSSTDKTFRGKPPLIDLISAPSSHPSVYEDKWDAGHVKMPCSPNNLNQKGISNWSLIKTAYQKDISNSNELEKAISSYSSEAVNLTGFHTFTNEVATKEETDRIFKHTLPGIISLALRLPEIVTQPPVLLSRQKTQSISLSQLQIASLLANAFLSTFPRRNTQTSQLGRSELANYPDINFVGLLGNHDGSMVMEKIRCILNYFDQVADKEPTGTVTFTREVIEGDKFPDWKAAQETFGGLYISSEGTIGKEGDGLLQMDFADSFIGGLILDWDCIQEEVLFAVFAELIVACLFTERIEDNEAVIVTGCEQYSRYRGYGQSFKFDGNYVADKRPRDTYGRRLCRIVAIDATEYSRDDRKMQYKEKFFLRELNKAYVGFRSRKEGIPLAAVATGNWGCGVFNGDSRFKSLIQLMAAAVAGRDVAYFTFGDETLRDDVFSMHTLLLEKKITVGRLYEILCKYGEGSKDGKDLYEYIRSSLEHE